MPEDAAQAQRGPCQCQDSDAPGMEHRYPWEGDCSPRLIPASESISEPRTPQGEGGDSGTASEALRDELARLIDPVDESYPGGRREGRSPLASAYFAADRVLAAGFRRVAEDPEPPKSFEPGHVYEITKRVRVDERGVAQFLDMPGGVAVGSFWSGSLSRVVDLGAALRGGEQQ